MTNLYHCPFHIRKKKRSVEHEDCDWVLFSYWRMDFISTVETAYVYQAVEAHSVNRLAASEDSRTGKAIEMLTLISVPCYLHDRRTT